MSTVMRILFALVVLAGITAFVAVPQPSQTASSLQAAATATPTLPPAPTPTISPTPAATRPDIILWWPAALYPPAGSPAEDMLLQQLDEFRASQDRSLLLRVKRLEGTGGIMSTLRHASGVAALVLPDLVLLPREELVIAAQTGLIVPLEGRLPVTLTGSLYTGARELGAVAGTLYGLSYLLEVQHLAYRPAAYQTPPDSLAALVEAGRPFALTIGHETSVSDTLLIQYVAEGGRLADEQGRPTLDEAPLRRVLSLYRTALDSGLLPPDALTTLHSSGYWGRFQSGGLAALGVDSATYLAQRGSAPTVLAAPLAPEDSPALTTLHGWLWVITTADPDRQTMALQFLNWIMNAERQGALSQILGQLPSQRAALRLWEDADYVRLADQLLSAPLPIPPEDISSAVASALQDALAAALRREQTPEQAAATAITAVARP